MLSHELRWDTEKAALSTCFGQIQRDYGMVLPFDKKASTLHTHNELLDVFGMRTKKDEERMDTGALGEFGAKAKHQQDG